MAAVVALIGGRTLVLPPASGHLTEEHQGAVMLSYDDGYDLVKMRQHLNAVTWTEFMECGGQQMLRRSPTMAPEVDCDDAATRQNARKVYYCNAMKEYSGKAYKVDIGKVLPGQSYFSVPAGRVAVDPMKDRFRRRMMAPYDHENPEYGKAQFVLWRHFLQCVGSYVYFDPMAEATAAWVQELALKPTTRSAVDTTQKQWIVGAMRDGLVYSREVRAVADAAVAELGGQDGFACIHLRRKDFKQSREKSVKPPHEVLQAYRDVLREGERLLVMTDDEDEVKRLLAGAPSGSHPSLDFSYWGDLGAASAAPLRGALNPLACQLACVSSREFIATSMSTYSGYVVKQRGLRNPSKGSYYVEASELRHDDAHPERNLPGFVEREFSHLWGYEPETGWSDM
eukprot:TRINITY_DN6413_c0_g1_i2.p1 TRINITY_DN6413_c0_g1~~TRINITY_DN6413_c0_g1_i2.p1  ORF type:complete len:397 (+),score=91.51 TRINITY_DN6413_c0_g1_i2:499-1689(+)